MANDSYSQQALARDPRFLSRLQSALGKVAWQVLEEPTNIPNHVLRVAFARQILSNPAGFASTFSPWFVMRTNVFAFVTTYSFVDGAVVTASGDADIESQLSTDWNILSGV